MRKNIFPILLVLMIASGWGRAQTATATDDKFTLKLRPAIKGCEDLKDADDPEITKVTKDLEKADAEIKIRTAGVLGKTCNKKSTDALVGLLQDKDPMVRVAAVEALGQLGNPEAIDSLIELQHDPEWKVRFILGPVLCSFLKQPASYAATNYIARPEDAESFDRGEILVRCQTIIAINQMIEVSFSRKTLRFMYMFLDAKNDVVRNTATEAMYLLKGTRNFPSELIGDLKQAINPAWRKKCAYWLGELKLERGRDILTEIAANDPDKDVKATAAEALKKLPSVEIEPESKPQKSTTSTKKSSAKPVIKKRG